MGILVIGSFMMDLVVNTPRVPENGETIIGTNFFRSPGGKGANQAVSASKLGGNVRMVGKVGDDSYGDEFIQVLKDHKINTDYILKDANHSTGVGSVTIDELGDNRIVVVPGANLAYTLEDLKTVESLIKRAKILILQLEMNIDIIEQAVTIAHENKVPIILNPAPAQVLSDDLLSKVTYLTPNETEAELLTGVNIRTSNDAVKAAEVLIGKGVENVILTLGDQGALIVNKSESHYVSGYRVKAIDSVAAGDSFNGALAIGILENKELTKVIKFANAVGALTVTKKGAISSLPTIEEVNDFMKQEN